MLSISLVSFVSSIDLSLLTLFKPKHVCGRKNAKNYFLLRVEPLGILDHRMLDEWNSTVPADELVV